MFPIFNTNNVILNALEKKKDNINDNDYFNQHLLPENLENYIITYLRHPDIKRYNNLFNGKTRKIKKTKKNLIFTLDIFSDNINNHYYCSTCKLCFSNVKSHDFNMYNKCPSVTKRNNFIIIKTIYETHHHNFKFSTTSDLDVELNILKDEKDKSFYITNYLFIKCPICLTFKLNCIIQRCGHCLRKDCLNNFLKSNNTFKCWLCRKSFNKNEKILLRL